MNYRTPDLRDLQLFVRTRATPYDPAAEDYPALALPGPIRTTRRSAVYAMHSYHQGKKPHDAIRQYIRHFSRPGELVLDPFCGSGGTALAAMLEGRTAIALDRSPAAVFIARNYCTPSDPNVVQQAVEESLAAARPELDWLYETRCDRCDGPARTVYTVYSEQFACPHCGQMTPLADCPRVSSGSKPATACPHCLARGHVEAIRSRGPRQWHRCRAGRLSLPGGMRPGRGPAASRRPGSEETRRTSPASTWARSRRSLAARFRTGGRPQPFRLRSLAGKPTFARRAFGALRTCIRSGIFGPWLRFAPARQPAPVRRPPCSR